MLHPAELAPFVAKLHRRRMLSDDDSSALLALPFKVRSYVSNATILSQDEPATHVGFVLKGFVSKVRRLDERTRQIVALHVVGDAVDIESMLFLKTDHALFAHSVTEVAWVAQDALRSVVSQRPALAEALWLDTLVDGGIFREWTVNLGQRGAKERIAHFILEIAARLDAVGSLQDDAFLLPLTQNDMAEALGMSLVHFNKSLGSLRQSRHLSIRKRTVFLLDRSGLIAMCGFSSRYLHLDQSRIEVAAMTGLPPAAQDQAEAETSSEACPSVRWRIFQSIGMASGDRPTVSGRRAAEAGRPRER